MPDRTILLALAALYEATQAAARGPMAPSLNLRALLALVHASGNGDREPYEAFWRQCLWPGDGQHADDYLRGTLARTHWMGIVRTLGLEPQGMELDRIIHELISRQREAVDPEHRARRVTERALANAKYDREIISTKGHPYSEAGRRLMADRIARGEEPA